MRRISTDDNAVLVNGVPQFKEANPPALATSLRDYWFNSVQEEIAAVIEGAGMTLDGTKTTQLRDAILRNRVVTTPLTITVNPAGGADFTTIQGALDSLLGRPIDVGVTVTIQLASADYVITSPIRNRHPQGSQIVIRGGATKALAATYRILCATHSFALTEYSPFAAVQGEYIRLSGVYIRDDGTSHPRPTFGIFARLGGVVSIENSTILSFSCGALAEDTGFISLSTVDVTLSTPSQLSGDALDYWGIGVCARYKGFAHCTAVVTTTSSKWSYYAEYEGRIIFENSTIGDRHAACYFGSIFQIKNSTLSSSKIYCRHGSTLRMKTVTVTGIEAITGVYVQIKSRGYLDTVTVTGGAWIVWDLDSYGEMFSSGSNFNSMTMLVQGGSYITGRSNFFRNNTTGNPSVSNTGSTVRFYDTDTSGTTTPTGGSGATSLSTPGGSPLIYDYPI